jgi:hypothetical protein
MVPTGSGQGQEGKVQADYSVIEMKRPWGGLSVA